MRTRKVVVMIEMETTVKLTALRDRSIWRDVLQKRAPWDWNTTVHQVQANVVKVTEGGKA